MRKIPQGKLKMQNKNKKEVDVMCKLFEEVTGKENKGNKGELKGLLKAAVDAKMNAVIISIPVELLDIDESYQTPERTARSLNYLVGNWDDNKLLPLAGVPHWEEGKVYLFDGFGRWIASQLISEPKNDLQVMVILNAPTEKNERRLYEAKMYAFQNKNVAKMTAVQKHGAMLLMHDKGTEILEDMKNKYGFEYTSQKGNRSASVLGSYTEALSVCKQGREIADYIFNICKRSGFDRKSNGYSTYVMRSLRDIYKLYPENRTEIENVLIKYLRKIEPVFLKSESVVKYPLLDSRVACSLFVEDVVVRELNVKHKRKLEDNKVTFIVDSNDLKEEVKA